MRYQEQVLRINQRYLEEVVEAFDLCPWAREVRDTPAFARKVFVGNPQDDPVLATAVAACIEEVASQATIDVCLLIFPTYPGDRRTFRRFVSHMEQLHAAEHPRSALPLAMAGFHPDAEADLQTPARLVSFIRRAPDPTIQLIRRSTLAAVRPEENQGSTFVENIQAFIAQPPPPKKSLAESIAKNNHRTIERVGVDTIEFILQDIAEDRAAAYRPFSEEGPIK